MAKNHELKDQLAALKAQVDDLAAKPEPPANPARTATGFPETETPQQLEAMAAEAKTLKRLIGQYYDDALSEPQKAEFEAWAKSRNYWDETTGEPKHGMIKGLKARCDVFLEDEVPARARYLQESVHWDNEATKVYPWLKDRSSKDFQAVQNVLREMPELKRFPSAKLWVARMIRGWQAEQREAAGKTNGKAKLPGNPPEAPAVPANRGARPATKESKAAALRDKAFASRSDEDVHAWVKSMVQGI